MVDILHRVGVRTDSTDAVHRALTTVDGLAGWWTDDTTARRGPERLRTGAIGVGDVIEFRFPPGGFDMEVLEQAGDERVVWQVVDGPAEWVGTTIRWTLRRDDDWTIVLFAHEGWAEPVEFMHHCSTKWATFLMSLKGLVEGGVGAPSPRDVHIAFPD